MNITEEQLKEMAVLFKSLSNPVRLRILEHLRVHPWSVCGLAEKMGINKSIVSKYLLQMKQAGLVDYKKRGVQVEYRLTSPCFLKLADCTFKEVMAYQKQLLRLPSEDIACES